MLVFHVWAFKTSDNKTAALLMHLLCVQIIPRAASLKTDARYAHNVHRKHQQIRCNLHLNEVIQENQQIKIFPAKSNLEFKVTIRDLGSVYERINENQQVRTLNKGIFQCIDKSVVKQLLYY